MKARINRYLNFAIILSLVLVVLPLGAQAASITPERSPAAIAPIPAWGASSFPSTEAQETTAIQPPDPGVEWKDLPPEMRAKVDPRILAELNGEVIPAHLGGSADQAEAAPQEERKPLNKTRFLVYLKPKADLEAIRQQRFVTRVEQRSAVFDALVSTAQATQGPVKSLLNARMSAGDVASYQSFYIFNGFAVEGDLETIIELAQRDDVERIVANYPLVPLWESGEAAASPANGLGGLDPDNWNVDLVDAERVWNELGITGEGAVVGGFDTGVDWTHPALQDKYRGYDGSGLGTDHNYNWFEADANLYPGGDLGPSVSTVPYDCDQHGTHTMGTMVGDGGTSGTQVGMAPGAEWIAAPGICWNTMPGGIGDDIGGLKTFQWFLCPTDLSGALSTADCSKAPDVVNNSWGSSNPADDTFYPAIQALRSAGIAPVFASGNPSAGAGSIGSPASAPDAITVGATDINDDVASFSGRGPSFYEGEQKPELSAPGVNVNSTVPGGGYSGPTWSGTSMAAPHVAGLVALMTQADLQDSIRDFNVDELERFMEYTSLDLGDPGPDDDYGYGRIDAYGAVRWALSAGDLQGTITDQSTGSPIAGAVITGTKTNPGDTFTVESGASGAYSTTIPAGTYDIAVDAWGYQGDTFSGQTVITGALSIKDFALTPMSTAVLTGTVLSGTTPISGALVHVAAHPTTQFTTGADGAYTLTLPVDTHAMVVEADGYRVLSEDVTVAAGGSSHDFAMTPAPTILLVEADAAYGWFTNRPVHNFFAWALDEENYLYDLWEIEYTTFTDTQTLADGSLGYGVPSTTTLRSYDLVIWAHTADSPNGIGANDELMDYLDSGGRLLISGQDIGYNDDGTTFYDDYLHADFVNDVAASEGETLSGDGFLSGLDLEITSGALHNYANTALGLWPDAAGPEDGAAYPVLTYDNGSGPAALAVDPCDASYRAVYFAVGYENVAPRAYNRDPAIAQVIDESIQWAWAGNKPTYDVHVSATPTRQTDEPGSTVTYDVQVANTGAMTDTFTMTAAGNLWPTRIYSGGVELTLTTTVMIPPCGFQDLTATVDIPATANIGEEDTATLTASGNASDGADVTTVAFPLWQVENPMPTPRYRLAAVNLPSDVYYYAIGGQVGAIPQSANERYDACSDQWETMSPLPTAVGNIQAAAIDDKVYVPGGYDGNTSTYYDILQIYDTTTDSWSTGATLSDTLWGAGVAAYNGKLYTFGGELSTGTTNRVFEYDPVTDSWSEKTPMPGGARSTMAAAELDGKIYVVGGWSSLRTVEVYDPTTDSWSTAASMNVGRQSPGLVAAPDGYLYVSGGGNGWTGLTSAERYDPATDTWEMVPSLNDANRAGSASAFAAGRVFAVGGVSGSLSDVNESLRIFDTFCLSDKAVQQSTVQPGDRVTYTVEIHSDAITLTASVTDPIPAGTTWAGFGANPAGATYDAGQDQVEWGGVLAIGADPLTFTFGVDVDPSGWTFGDLVTNTAVFDSGAGQIYTRTTTTEVIFPDPSPSAKAVNASEALAGDVLTYTVRVENASSVSDTFALIDPIPAHTTYVPGSLTYTLGTGGYDVGSEVITWTGALPYYYPPYTNSSGNYEWGDSDGDGTVPDVIFDWVDVSATGTNAGSGDDQYYCGLPLGFTFDFYGTAETDFCASTNGFASFDTGGGSDWSNDCPLPSTNGNAALIAGIWDDLVVDGGIYYQTFGSSPNHYTVIQWVDVRHFGGSEYFDFQIILYENNDVIKVQILDAGPETGSGSTTGIEDYAEATGLTYACNTVGSIHDELAVLFLPDGATWQTVLPFADVTFAVTTTAPLPANTFITNTATISGPLSTVERSASTLVNPVDLNASTKAADREWAGPGQVVTYDFFLANTGLLTSTAALTDSIPAHTAYVSGSVTCGGACGYDPGTDVITWSGDIAAGSPVTLTFAVTLTDALADMTFITNTATLDDGAGTLYELTDTFLARSPDLSASFKQAVPDQVEPGGAVTYTVYVRNTGFVDGEGEMRDELPTELTYVTGSVDCGSGSCGEASGVITWTGTAPARSIVPVQFRAMVPSGASHGDLITNTATVTDVAWSTTYPVEAVVEVVEPADLWLSKDGIGTVEAGHTLVYTLTYGNAGPYDTTTAAQVVDTLPAGVSYVGSSPTGVYSATAGTVTWDVGTLNAGVTGTLILTIRVPISAPPPTALVNEAEVTPIPRDVYVTNNADDVTTTVTPTSDVFDLTLAPSTAAHTGGPGTSINYTLQVLNSGNTTDTFDVALAGNSWSTSASPMTVGPLAAKAKANVLVTVNIPTSASDGDTDTVTTTVTSQGDPNQAEDSVLMTEASANYAVMVTPNADTQSDDPGETVTYTLQVRNTGNAPDTFGVAVSGNAWATTPAPTSVGPLAPGATEDVDVAVTIPADAQGGSTDMVTVTVTSQGDGSKSATASLVTVARYVFGVQVTAPTDAQSGEVGTTVTYTLRVTNTSNTAEMFDVAASGAWTTTVASAVGPLGIGAGTDLLVTVSVPVGASDGDTDVVTMTITSQGDPTQSDGATLTTQATVSEQKIYLPLVMRNAQ